jgi:hypothetical protein
MKYLFLEEQDIDECNEEVYNHCNSNDPLGSRVNNDQADDPEIIDKFKSGKKII